MNILVLEKFINFNNNIKIRSHYKAQYNKSKKRKSFSYFYKVKLQT